ncbi:MAG: flagellar hook protein FlgE [Thiobacillaceae bacterium]|nr:flagellar hook protein FlgE [Thiobacillaceae bacterium]
MSFQQGLSGLNAATSYLDVTGNNIANTATVGFKSGSTQFADVYATSLTGSGSLQVGIGVQVADIAQKFTQGNTSVTNNPLDVAINGEGFFRINNAGMVTYTRNGQFQLDKDGYVVNNGGMRLTGYNVSGGQIVQAAPADIQISFADISPNATSRAGLVLNLDASESPPAVAPFSPANASTYNDSTSMTLYDSLGNSHAMTLYFVKTGANAWNMYGDVDGLGTGNVTLGGANPAPLAFNANGQLTTAMPLAVAVAAAVTPGAAPLSFNLSLTGSTQYGSNFGVNSVSQDGYSSGRIAALSIAQDGMIMGSYTNGQSNILGQVALANFVSPRGLQSLGNNQWAETSESGQPIVGAPSTGTLGLVQSGAVEESNVDLTAELVNLIVAQRMYQANAQTIRAQDQILQTLINLR